MKFWKSSLAFTALLVMYFCSLAASASWEHTVDQLDKELKVTDKRIVDLEARPK